MYEELARDYLRKSDFNPMQAEALAKLYSQMATRDDLRALSDKLDGMETRLRAEIVRAIAESHTSIMRWGISMIVGLATIMTLLELFVG